MLNLSHVRPDGDALNDRIVLGAVAALIAVLIVTSTPPSRPPGLRRRLPKPAWNV